LEKSLRKAATLFLKVAVSVAALCIVFQNIDQSRLVHLFTSVNLGWFALGFLLYNLSKVVSAFRLSVYFLANGIQISNKENLNLYYLGMFYNLFLPGGIGGDAYKVWLISRHPNYTAKLTLQSILFDRFSGTMALGAFCCVFGWWAFPNLPFREVLLVALLVSVPLFYTATYILARPFIPSFTRTSLLSMVVQGTQVLCAWSLLNSLSIQDNLAAYFSVFLFSSLVSVLPISIGGIGMRELVFVMAAGFSPIAKDDSVAFSLLFFFVTALSSLPGGAVPSPRLKN